MPPGARTKTKAPASGKPKAKSAAKPIVKENSESGGASDAKSHTEHDRNNFGLTVRIEINLPASGDQDTYDKIFKSIRSNLINV